MAETYLLEANDLAKNIASLNTTLQRAFGGSRQGGIVAMATPQNPQMWGAGSAYHASGSYMSVHRVSGSYGQPPPGGPPVTGTVYPPGNPPGAGGGGGGMSARPQYGGGYANGGYPPGGGGGGGGNPPTGGGGVPFGRVPMPTPPGTVTVPTKSGPGIAGKALAIWDMAVSFGEEKLPTMAAMQYYAARAQRQMSGAPSSYGGMARYDYNVAQRNLIKSQIFGSRPDSTLSTIAQSPEDAMSADWILGNYAGSRDVNDAASYKMRMANASFRAMAMSNPYASATSTAGTERTLASASMQRRSLFMGIGDTYRGGVYKGTARNMENYIQRVYGRGVLTPEGLTRSLADGQYARATFDTYTQGWSEEAKENFRAQLESYVKARSLGATPEEYEKTLAKASQDESDPAQAKDIRAAKKRMNEWGFTDQDIIAQNRKRSVTDAKDAQLSEGFMASVQGVTDGLTKLEKALNQFLNVPFIKHLLEMSGGAATVNPALQSGWNILNSVTGGAPGFLAKFLGFGASPGGERSASASASGSGGGNSSPSSPTPRASSSPSTTPANASTALGKGKGKSGASDVGKRVGQAAHGVGSRAAVIDYAMRQRGIRYVWGGGNRNGPTKGGFDCSSLVEASYWHGAHVDITRTTYTQMATRKGRDISPKEAQPGDLVYAHSGGHVRMYLGPNKYIHAPRTGDVVRVVRANPFEGLTKVRSFLGPHAGKVDVGDVPASSQSADAAGGDPSGGKAGLGTGQDSNSATGGPDVATAPKNEIGSTEEIDAIRWFFGRSGGGVSSIEERQQALDLESAKKDAAASAGNSGAGNGKSSSGSSTVPIPKAHAGNATAQSNKKLGQRMADAMYHWAGRQWDALNVLWERESNWNHRASNPGSGAYGIPQSLPGSKMASEGADWRTNPETQIKWGLKYIKGRYGSPVAAWKHWQAGVPIKGRDGKVHQVGHWYEKGAWKIEDDQPALLHKGEMVVEAKAAEQIRNVLVRTHAANGVSASANSGQLGGGVTFHFAPGAIQLSVGQGASPAAARQIATEFAGELERISQRKKIARGY